MRSAASVAGILPDDVLAPVVEALADAPGETAQCVSAALAPAMAQIEAFTRQAGQIAARPVLTPAQAEEMARETRSALHVRSLLYALGILAVVSAFWFGAGILWEQSRTRSVAWGGEIHCDLVYRDRPICYRFNGAEQLTPATH